MDATIKRARVPQAHFRISDWDNIYAFIYIQTKIKLRVSKVFTKPLGASKGYEYDCPDGKMLSDRSDETIY
jgi:hypothetical protein